MPDDNIRPEDIQDDADEISKVFGEMYREDTETPEQPSGEEAPTETPAEEAKVEDQPASEKDEPKAEPEGEEPPAEEDEPEEEEAPKPQAAKPKEDAAPAPKQPTEEDIKKHRKAMLERMTKRYEEILTDELFEGFEENPRKVLAKLAAQQHLDSFDSIYAQMLRQAPQIVQQTMEASRAAQETEATFFEQFPNLNKPEYGETVTRIASAYRQANPTADRADVIKEVGAMAMSALGLSAEEPAEPAPARKKSKPFTPAGAVAQRSATPGSKKVSENIFEEFAKELVESGDL